jgi:MOSC domain-containing protein YiiM
MTTHIEIATAGVPLLGLLTGRLAPLGAKAVPSGIAKTARSDGVALGLTGFAGDEQGDTVKHGGPEKAVHHYPHDHYEAWKAELDGTELLQRPGAFGENLSTQGLTEVDVAVGDVFRLGSAVVEVSQGRQPCWKLNERFGQPTVAKSVQTSGRTGWYYRVIETGWVAPDDRLVLIDRRTPEWTIRQIWHYFYIDRMNVEALARLADLSPLAESWRTYARKRLETREVEDWTKRLTGRAAQEPTSR